MNPAVFLRISLAIIYIWFGGLKLLGVSPAEGLAGDTMAWIFPPNGFVIGLGVFEVLLGLMFLYGRATPYAFWLTCLHLLGTLLPFVVLPDVVMSQWPHVLTLEGQYIIKNLLIFGSVYYLYKEDYVRTTR